MCEDGVDRSTSLKKNTPVTYSRRVHSLVALHCLNMHILWVYIELVCVICIFLIQRLLTTVIVKQLGPTTVTTKYGKLRGSLVEFPNDSLAPVEAYYGVQYASLRNNFLRCMPPTSPTERWSSTRIFSDYKPVCPQKLTKPKVLSNFLPAGTIDWLTRITSFAKSQIEDCLSMNLHVPIREWNETDKLPVMIFIHGESYEVGTGNAYDGSVLASYGGVIVITVNYRLGVLGFLSTGDSNADGNYALWDLLAILFWVKENIEQFGGDTGRVTLFGHGHGAALVNLLLFTNSVNQVDRLEGLVNNVILQSGSAYSTWATSIDPFRCAQLIARSVNCSHVENNSQALVTCFRERAVDDLVKSVPLTPKYFTCFAPTLGPDKLFTFGKSLDGLVNSRQSRFASIKMMFGLTKKEAYSYLKQNEIENGISENRKKQIIRTYVQNIYKYHRQKIYDILQHEYTQWEAPADDFSRRDDIMDLLSDGQYKAPLVKMAQEHSKTADTYFYSFQYSTQSEDFPQWSGGVHGDELPYIFGAPLVGGLSPFRLTYTSQEIELSKFMMRMWTNFAKTGDPNMPEWGTTEKDRSNSIYSTDERWLKYNTSTQSYLNIGRKGPKVREFFRAKEMALWLKLIPKLNTPDVNGSDASNQLENAENMSTFDDPSRLISRFHSIFPNPPPPPYTPPFTPPQSDPAYITTQDDDIEMYTNKNVALTRKPNGNQNSITPNKDIYPNDEQSMETKNSGNGMSSGSANVPLSVVIAIGCSLLFLNLIIFAGMYYQRKRIIRLKSENNPPPDGDSHDDGAIYKTKETERTPELANTVQTADSKPHQKVAALNHRPVTNSASAYQVISKATPPIQGPDCYTYSALSQKTPSPMHVQTQNQTTSFINTPTPNRPSLEDSSTHAPTNPQVTDRLPNSDPRSKSLTRAAHHITSNNAITIV